MNALTDLEAVFLEALEKGSLRERDDFLERACRGQAQLRLQVERMLAAHPQVGDFLESPPTAVARLADTRANPPADLSSFRFLSPDDRPDWLGRLGHYAIEEVIGCGGFGVVFKGRDEKLRRTVAIKTLAESLAASATARARFVREAQAAAAVNHENVVRIYAVEEAGPVPYLVMEHVAGLSLDEKLRREGRLELDEVLRIGIEIASGLAAAHAQGLVHRDVKPANILLEAEGFGVQGSGFSSASGDLSPTPDFRPPASGRVKITDFGLARAVDDASISRDGIVAGTPEYMSPEQARGASVDQRSDLFSLGSVLYAMCTGRSPFAAEGSLAVLRRIVHDTPQDVRAVRPEVSGMLAELISRLHARRPADRPFSADEVRMLLDRCRYPLTKGRPGPRLSRRLWLVATGSAAAAAGLWFCVSRLRHRGRGQEQNLPPEPATSQATAATNRRRWQPRVLIVIAPRDFYYPEYGPVRNALEAHGVECRVASTTLDECLPNDKSPQIPVTPELLLADAQIAEYDAIYFCGGEGCLEYAEGGRYFPEARRLIREALAAKCTVAAMGMGVVVLAEADVLRGQRAAGFPYGKPPGIYVRRIEARGVHVLEDAVVEDGLFLTGRAPQHVRLFIDSFVKRLGIEPRPPPGGALSD